MDEQVKRLEWKAESGETMEAFIAFIEKSGWTFVQVLEYSHHYGAVILFRLNTTLQK